jgi:four helix bundle protein
MKTNFEDLRAYKPAEALADEIWPIVAVWDYLARDTIGKQLINAADSVGANIAEGSGRGSPQDNKRFLYIARGSLYETKHWLRRAYKRNLLTGEQSQKLRDIMDELLPTLNAYIRSVKDAANR